MSNNKLKDLKTLFIPSDVMPISMILIGIIITIFISEIAIKLIGVSISLLGIVVLLMKLTTRLSSSIESKFKTNPPPNFKITIKKSPEAVRQVIENYSDDIDDDEVNNESVFSDSEKNEINFIPKKNEIKETMGEDEGFRIIKKEPQNENNANDVTLEDNTLNPEIEEKPIEEIFSNELDENEGNIKYNQLSNQESKSTFNYKTPHRFRKREIDVPTQGLWEEMPILKEQPDKEFEFFINRILMAIRSVSNTRTATFFFFNEFKNEIILNSYATESKRIVDIKTKFTAGNDIVSQIARSMKPEILSDINPAAELDLLPYYKSNSGTNSFIGIPVIYDKNVIGVLTADSKHSDAYDAVMVNFLSHFAKLISGLIRSYSDKYDLALDSKYYKSLVEFDSMNVSNNIKMVNADLIACIKDTISCENIYSIEFVKTKNKYKILSIANKEISYFKEDFEFYNDNSLLTETITTGDEIYLSNPEYDVVKINEGESKNEGFIYILPLSTELDIYGAIVIEGLPKSSLDKSEKIFLKNIVKKAANKLEMTKLIQLINSGFDHDPESGILTDKSIEKEITREITRTSNYNYNSSVASISFDKYKSIDDENEFINDTIINHLFKSLESTLDKLDSIGRQNDNLIVLLSGKNSQTSKLWAERIRNKIASESLYLADKRYNITVSIGICELSSNSRCQDILNNTNKALEVSKQKSNTVSIYS